MLIGATSQCLYQYFRAVDVDFSMVDSRSPSFSSAVWSFSVLIEYRRLPCLVGGPFSYPSPPPPSLLDTHPLFHVTLIEFNTSKFKHHRFYCAATNLSDWPHNSDNRFLSLSLSLFLWRK